MKNSNLTMWFSLFHLLVVVILAVDFHFMYVSIHALNADTRVLRPGEAQSSIK
jgi:hypothetical protein